MNYLCASLLIILAAPNCFGGLIYNSTDLTGGSRWDAAPNVIAGNERSLAGGIRYSVSGGSYQSFRDAFSWNTLPTVAEFQTAVEHAFSAWTSVDPVSGIGTTLSFAADFATSVASGGFGTLNFNGAEIDILASNAGDAGLRGITTLIANPSPVTLTSGVANYADSSAIAGVDIHLNNNASAVYSLDVFRRLLTHEIGHAIGLGDVDFGGQFIDDNYSAANAVETLNNSWITLINPLDPANSAGIGIYSVLPSAFTLNGVDLLMESNGLGIGASNPLTKLIPLTNDEYAMRQFLYPQITAVPEPASGLLILASAAVFSIARKCRIKRNWAAQAA